jgi:predicted nucleic acid-binding protein
VRAALTSGEACISFQVVQETLQVVARKLDPPASAADARRLLDDVLAPLWTVSPTPALYRRALELQAGDGFSFYDALIVAAALEAGCTRLLSEDLQDGRRIERLTIENPFAER